MNLKKNILNFGYGINFKYERMPSHSIEGYYVVTLLILPIMEDIKIKLTAFDMHCSYLDIKLDGRIHVVKHIPNMENFCAKILPYISHYQIQDDYYNKTVHNILTKEISIILPNFNKHK